MRNEPYFTQSGKDREDNPDQYIANISDGTVFGFKYFDLRETKRITVRVRGNATGILFISLSEKGPSVAEIPVSPSSEYKDFTVSLSCNSEKSPLFFQYKGAGRLDMQSMTLE